MPDAGWFTLSLLVLPLQAIAAVASVRVFASRVAPNIARLHSPAGALDSLGPFALALPLICAGWRVGWNAAGAVAAKGAGVSSAMPAVTSAGAPNAAGWIAVGAPIIVALLAIGAAMCAPSAAAFPDRDRLRVLPGAAAAWSATGAILLLLGAAHDLTIWAGQCAFATGAVLLWVNTPDLPRERPESIEAQAGSGLSLMLLCAMVQAAAIAIVPARFLPIAAGLAIAHAAMIVTLAACLAASFAAVRIGGWTATYGVLLGLGAISLQHLLPQMFSIVRGNRDPPPVKVAYGFGAFAVEATALLLFGAASLAAERLPTARVRVLVGVAIVVAAATLAGWRLAGG